MVLVIVGSILHFMYLFLAGVGLRCSKQGLLCCGLQAFCCRGFSCGARALESVGFCSCGFRALTGSVVVAYGLSCSVVCGIFLDRGWNLYPLHWQAYS